MIFVDQMGDDRIAVADRRAVVLDVRQLPARCGAGIENMLMTKWYFGQAKKRESLEPERIIVSDPEQFRVGVEREHGALR
jgi:hypothetical protein